MKLLYICALTGLAATGCVEAGPSPAIAPSPVAVPLQPRMDVRPLVDAHQHLMSPAAMALPAPAASPAAVTLPAPLARLLEQRQHAVENGAIDTVFTPEAVIFAEEQGRWWRGRDKVANAVGGFSSELKFVPIDYSVSGDSGFVSGILRWPDGTDDYTFMLGLRRVKGNWMISSEMKQPIMPPVYAPSITAEKVVAALDDAGIQKGVVLSVGYWFGNPRRDITDRAAKTRAENDWTVAEAARFPDRLVPFCGVNPIADYALDELARCAAIPSVKGMKMHFGNAMVDLANPDHIAKLRQFFKAAQDHRMAIVIHFRGSVETFVDQVLPAAPNVTVQIAHMASGWDNLSAFADAIVARKPGTDHLYFDWTQALPIEGAWGYGVPSSAIANPVPPETRQRAASIMRRIGLDRILYGTDMALSWNPSPREWWTKTVLTLPLTDAEIRDIADNVPSYLQ